MDAFAQRIPDFAKDLKSEIAKLSQNDAAFEQNLKELHRNFLEHNSAISIAAVKEFIVQHCLTIDLFRSIFGVVDFEKLNPIARLMDEKIMHLLCYQHAKIHKLNAALLRLVETEVQSGYCAPHDKQRILILIYERFFKAYNPQKADSHGIVYTPLPVVHFMIKSCDNLLHQHFGRRLHDEGVRILDPCTGTGTFITGLIDYIPRQHIEKKAKDIYAIEVDVMAYYMAQLNTSEAIREQLGHSYIQKPFVNLALADTLEIGTAFPKLYPQLSAVTRF